MTFPTGWTHKVAVTVDHTKVTGTPTGMIWTLTKEQLPATFCDAGATSAQEGGGDIRITTDAAGTTLLPREVNEFHPDATSGNRRCEIFVNLNGHEPSNAVDTTYYVWCKGPTIMQQPYPAGPYGQEAVWSDMDYKTVLHYNKIAQPQAWGLYPMRPRAQEAGGYTYLTYLEGASGGTGRIYVTRYNQATGVWDAAVNVVAGLLLDGHASPTICVDTSGYIHLTYCGYSSGGVRTIKSTNPNSIAAWGSAVVIKASGPTEDTYPRMQCLSTGTLVLTTREDNDWVKRVSTDNGATWSAAQTIITGVKRAYCEWILGASDRLHVAWHYVDGAVNGLNVAYMYSDNPSSGTSTWKAIDGTAISVPVAPNAPTNVATGLVFNSSAFNNVYIHGLAVDGSNAPIVSCAAFDTGTPANSCYKSFTYGAGSWTGVNVMAGATTGIDVSGAGGTAQGGLRYLTGTTWRALCAVTVSGLTQLQEFESTNGGASWAKLYDLTSGGTASTHSPQYTWNTTGPAAVVAFWAPIANSTNPGYNFSSDILFAGTHTDGVASWARDCITPGNTYRDSTKYHNHPLSVTGSPTTAASAMGWGGTALSLTASDFITAPKTASNSTDLATSIHVEQWCKHTAGGATEKTGNRDGGATGATSQWGMYRSSGNAAAFLVANGTNFAQAISAASAGAGVVYRMVGQYSGGSVSGRFNKTAIGAAALTGSATLTTALSSPDASGYTMAGTLDERRESANLIALNTLDTQYDNMTSPATFASGVDVAMGSNAIRNLAWLL